MRMGTSPRCLRAALPLLFFSFFSASLFLSFPGGTLAKVEIGTVGAGLGAAQWKQQKDRRWAFLGKFCFSTSGEGELFWDLGSGAGKDSQLVLFDDEDPGWFQVWANRSELSCDDVLNAKGAHPLPGVMVSKDKPEKFRDVERPHFWFVAAADCSLDKGSELDLKKFELTFFNAGGPWEKQFSFDEQSVAGMYTGWWIIFTLGALLHGWGCYVLYRSGSYHPIVKILSVAVVLEWLVLFFSLIHWLIYKDDGIGAPGLYGFAELLDMSSQLLFTFLLLLVAKGWAVTHNNITDKKFLLIAFCGFFVVYVALFIWHKAGQDPAETLYMYETAPGIILACLRIVLLFWFLWCLRQSHMHESNPTKKKFYAVFGGFSTLWFLVLPGTVLIAAALAPWVRFKIVISLYVTGYCAFVGGMAFLLWPSRAAEFFAISDHDLLLGIEGSPYETL
jgi:GPR180/TMEM145, transmembrane domain